MQQAEGESGSAAEFSDAIEKQDPVQQTPSKEGCSRSLSTTIPGKPRSLSQKVRKRASVPSMQKHVEEPACAHDEEPEEAPDEKKEKVPPLIPADEVDVSAELKNEFSLLDAEVPMPGQGEHDKADDDIEDPFATHELSMDLYPTVDISAHVGSQFDSQMSYLSTTQLQSQSSSPYGSQFGPTHSSAPTGVPVLTGGYDTHPGSSQTLFDTPSGTGGTDNQASSPPQTHRASLTGSQPLPSTMFVQHAQMVSPWQHHPLSYMQHRPSLPVAYSTGCIPVWGDQTRKSFAGTSFMSAGATGAETTSGPTAWTNGHNGNTMPLHLQSPYPYYQTRTWQSVGQQGTPHLFRQKR